MGTAKKIGLGGGCHWCTEAVFQSLKGILQVQQGYIASTGEAAAFSEAVVVTYDPDIISLKTLVEMHLHTHEATSQHSFREKYRSAVYYFEEVDQEQVRQILQGLQKDFEAPLITLILAFAEFKASRESLQDYYLTDPERPFCKRYIEPKIQLLLRKYKAEMK